MKNAHFRSSLMMITTLVVILIAILSAAALWYLHDMQYRSAHATAAMSVMDKGALLAKHLAGESVVKEAGVGSEDWSGFSRQIRSLCAMDDDLQYVSVMKDGITVFHEQRDSIIASEEGLKSNAVPPDLSVGLSRELLGIGNEVMPVVVFSTWFTDNDGVDRTIEVALKRGAVQREEMASADAIVSMFKVSLLTVIISFGVCVLLIIWMIRRENVRESKRRQEEHLAFAGVMANGIVHDFRNPMSALRLDVQMLNKEANKQGDACDLDRLKELSERARITIDRMDKVFQEFLYISGPSRDKREKSDLTACLKDCVTLMKPRIEQAGQTLDIEFGTEKIEVLAYQLSLNRVLLNVIGNAEHFAGKGGMIRVLVSKMKDEAVIDVMDNGPGISEDDLSRVFDMFFSTRPDGTGLGLFLAKTAVEKSGGTIKAMNRPEGGAWFRITLQVA